MKISEIHVEHFGAWQALTLPLNQQGLTVLHGPNEAGKTTLMRFVRGMLYGFPPPPGAARETMTGSLRISGTAGEARLHRTAGDLDAASAPRGDLSLSERSTLPDQSSPREFLDVALQGIGESVYEHVFAIGLRELQELATLNDREVAEQIYGMTLGLEGQRLLRAWTGIREDRRRLLDPATNSGTLAELWTEHERLDQAVRNHPDPAERHALLAGQRDEWQSDLASCRQRQAGIQSQLRGHQFLESAHGPWSLVRDGRDELEALPVVRDFPENGIERLLVLEAERTGIQQTRDRLAAERKRLQHAARRLAGDPEVRKHAGAMHGFLLQRNWIGDLQSRTTEASRRLTELRTNFQAHCRRLGDHWTEADVDEADVSTAAHQRLTSAAQQVKRAARRCKTLTQRGQRMAQTIKARQADCDARLAALGAGSVDDALAEARRQMQDLKPLAALRLRENELIERQAEIHSRRNRVKSQHLLPTWVYAVLIAFCVAGAALGCWGLAASVRSSEIAGLTYILLGLTTGGIAWGIKAQFESDARQQITELEAEARQTTTDLEATRQQIHQLTASCDLSEFADLEGQIPDAPPLVRPRSGSVAARPDESGEEPADLPMLLRALHQVRGRAQTLGQTMWKAARQRMGRPKLPDPEQAAPDSAVPPRSEERGSQPSPEATDPSFELAVIQQIASRVADLEQLRRNQQQVQRSRLRMAERGKSLKLARRDLDAARQNWNELLRQHRFPQTLKARAVFEHWHVLVETKDCLHRCREAEAELGQVRSLWTSFRHRLEELDRRMNQWPGEHEQPLDVLDRWENQLVELAQRRHERKDVLKLLRVRSAELSRAQKQLRAALLKKDALLLQGGAGDAQEFEHRARCAARRVAIERQVRDAQDQLAKIVELYRDLAIVEEDLRVFRPDENRQAIATLVQELDDLESDVTRISERLGATRREMELLEDNRDLTRLRFEREQVAARLQTALEQWLAVESAANTIDEMRSKFERTCQPRVLAMASRHLHRMTAGRYTNIWTPLDRRELQIEDSRQASCPVEQLSSGTREQLFLAVRLALIEDLSQKGIHLPVILDDVFVNFDEGRAAAAAELLMDFARQGQQVLVFTCHKHLAEIFTRLGAPAVELPARESGPEVRRLAG